MKFLCRNCKAKYQIADEKVAGRTLRMTCQQCGETIVVRGVSRSSAAVPAARAPAALGAQAGSALGAEFQRQLAGPAREVAPSAHEEWHVAINDVPVGPMRRDEVARKIAAGAVDRESLAWREGMDDWLAIKHIPELSALCVAPGSSPGLAPPPSAASASLPASPAARTDMAPIGGRQVVAVDDYESQPEREAEAVAVATMAAAPAEPATPAGRPLGWGPMFALVSGGAFILAAGAFLGVRVLAPSGAPAPGASAATAPAAAPGPAPSQVEPANQDQVIQLDEQAIDGKAHSGSRRAPTGSSQTVAAVDKGKGKQLTDEQRALLERMGGGLDQGPSKLRAPSSLSGNSNRKASQLTASQLKAVVLKGRKNLQRCYETALRGANSTDTVRLDVDIQVSPNGNVTHVHTSGQGLPGMGECISRTVKMWRFPTSGQATQTRFPVVFQPGN